ncbi:hypothetical protein BJV82DRAFT_665780 [Fennellomyces sp. T-0311]|nr:hypothetical protein BJV82DRAFT_665780 [Fennellomyces sp. T-0311]
MSDNTTLPIDPPRITDLAPDEFDVENSYFCTDRGHVMPGTHTERDPAELKGYCNRDDNLVTLLSKVSSQTPVEILFDGCSYDKTFILLLKAFPSLLRFIFIDGRYQDPDLPLFVVIPDVSQDLFLTRLFVRYSRIDVHKPLVTVLKKCSHLQYLAYDRATINLDQLFSCCPKLIYLEADLEDLHKYRCNVINRLCFDYARDSPGLRGFIGRDSSQVPPSMIGYHLMRNADTLEHLVLETSMRAM